MTDSTAERVRRYFDVNTRWFLRTGHNDGGAIRRTVWGPGVTGHAAAMAYVDELVLQRLPGNEPHVVDLGCGVCASLCRMAQRAPLTGTGVTLSPAQVTLARARIEQHGLANRVTCEQGDFCEPNPSVRAADLAFGIESFVLASSSEAFFEQCAALVKPGGRLIVCDDFLSDERWRSEAPASKWLRRFADGWHAHNLKTEAQANALATRAGFTHEETVDLTPHLALGRPRDLATAALMRTFGWLPVQHPYWLMLYGGHALQVGLQRGWLKYLFMVWRR